MAAPTGEAARPGIPGDPVRTDEEPFRALVEQSSDLTMVVDEAGTFTFVSPSFQTVTGVSPSEAVGRSAFAFNHPDDVRSAREALRASVESPGTMQRVRVRVRRADGTWALLSATLTNMLDVPSVRGIVVHNRDVTARAEAERVILDREARLRAYFETPAVGIAITSPEKGWMEANDFTCSMLGYTRDELFRKTWVELTHPEDVSADVAAFERVVAGEIDRYSLDKRFIRSDGATVWTLLSVSCVRRGDGSIDYFVAILEDITDRKRAEQALRSTSDYLEKLIDYANAPIIVWDPARRITLFNHAFEAMTGYPASDVIGRDLSLLFPEESRAESLGKIATAAVGARWQSVEIPIRCRTGEVRVALWNSANVTSADGSSLQATIAQGQDITERKQAEQALRESQRWLLQSQEIARIGSYVLDVPADRWASSVTLDAIFGIDAGYPHTGDGWLQLVHPDDRDATERYFADVLARGSRFDREYRIVNRRSSATRWVHGLGELKRGPSGEALQLVGTIQDVTDRKMQDLEREALQDQLALASRLAAMGTLVAGVAHEINNPLAASLSGQGVALEEARELRRQLRGGVPLDGEAARRLDLIVESLEDASEGGQRVAGIVKDLASFAKPDPRRARIRLADVAAAALRWLPAALAQSVDVRVEDAHPPPVLASSGQLEQVVVNLLTNAAKATRPGTRGTVTVRIGPGAPGTSRLDVVDEGTGIAPEHRARIFEPFFTTRPVGAGRGAGLGLAICHAIVTAHGGTLTVESQVGKGSTFRLELPAAPEG